MAVTLRGAYTALMTPFRDGRIDEQALRDHVERQIDGGINGLVPCGTTAEAATMSEGEQLAVVETVVDQAAGRVPVVAGTGSNDTAKTVRYTRRMSEIAGVDAALVVVPYYNKPSQAGLIAHFRAVADEGGLPVVLYNVPGRTSCSLTPESTAVLAEHPNIIAIKDATADMVVATRIRELCGRNLTLLSGDDFTTLPLLSVGGSGCISVVSNLDPGAMSELCAAAAAEAWDRARQLHMFIQPLARALFADANPIPLKTAAAMLDGALVSSDCRCYRPRQNCRPDCGSRCTATGCCKVSMMSDPVRVAVVGAAGRMGEQLLRVAPQCAATIAAVVVRDDEEKARVDHHAVFTTGSLTKALEVADVVVEFTGPSGFAHTLQTCVHAGTPFVSGTTGLQDQHLEQLDEAATSIPVLWAPNFSMGVAVTERIVELAAAALRDFDIEIVEAHHRRKVDAPSGTALFLGEAAARGRSAALEDVAQWQRHGQVGPRTDPEIGFQVVRGGDIVGEHTVLLCGMGERVEITHRASDRGIFARGALRAAKWLSHQPAGRYAMRDVLFG